MRKCAIRCTGERGHYTGAHYTVHYTALKCATAYSGDRGLRDTRRRATLRLLAQRLSAPTLSSVSGL
eukprot:15450639-Alexandrium_andersonii.AAC.1